MNLKFFEIICVTVGVILGATQYANFGIEGVALAYTVYLITALILGAFT